MRIELSHRATEDLDRLQRGQPRLYQRVVSRIQSLSGAPNLGKPLVGPLKGIRSLRIGDYRVLYRVQDDLVVVLTINHRREVYRR